MKALIISILLCGCAKYQVIQELRVNMYHLHNPKLKKMEIILTEDSLEIGKWYRLKSIKTIQIDD